MDSKRKEILDQLCSREFIKYDDPSFFHGRIYKSVPPLPEVTWECSFKPRGDLEGPEWLTGTEFSDQESVFKDKVKKLARLIRLSKKTVIYSGAGISVAAGINQAARSSEPSQLSRPVDWWSAGCSRTMMVSHRRLVILRRISMRFTGPGTTLLTLWCVMMELCGETSLVG